MRGRVPQWNQLPNHAQNDLKNWKNWFIGYQSNDELRLTALNIYVKLKYLGLWKFVKGPAGNTNKGCLNFVVNNVRDFKDALRRRKDFTVPESSSQEWSSRENRVLGSLHFKHNQDWGHTPTVVQAHVDLFGLSAPLFHWKTKEKYQDVYGIRNMLLGQGLDRKSLLTGSSNMLQQVQLKSSIPKTWTHMLGSTTSTRPGVIGSSTLRQGARGPDVTAIQKRLGIRADGIYGPRTKAAVADYQRRHGLKADGIFGRQTRTHMLSPLQQASQQLKNKTKRSRPMSK